MKKNLCMAVAVAIAAALALAACAGKGQMTDKEVLMKIYEDLNGKNWGERFNKNWGSELPLDEWYGVEVNEEGRVTKLSLSSDSVKGNVPAEIKYLTELKAFKVTVNNKGTTHDKAIPAEVWQLPHLKELRLYEYCGKGMQSEIPSEVNLPELELLYTNIQYADMAPLCHIATLSTLSMSDFNGAIPEEICQLTNLTELSLRAIEGLNGAVPNSIGKLTRLVKLEITADGKGQSGFAFPSAVWNLSGIKWLTLRNVSGLQSQIPASKVGEMKQLTSMSIIQCGLNGPIPPQLFTASGDLLVIDLTNNALTGEIPAEVGHAAKLSNLMLSNNDLGGTIPASLGNCNDLRVLTIKNNPKLGGEIPASLGRCKKLAMFNLGHTAVSHNVPIPVRNLPKWNHIATFLFM